MSGDKSLNCAKYDYCINFWKSTFCCALLNAVYASLLDFWISEFSVYGISCGVLDVFNDFGLLCCDANG